LKEVLDVLAPRPGETVLDVTLGLGGHAAAFLERIGPQGRLIGLDADKENLELARERLAPFGDRVQFFHANFRDLPSLGLPPVDILFADLGLSSPHLDDPQRGFSFRTEIPLDLRFDRSQGIPASQWLRQVSGRDLTSALRAFGELRRARPLAEALHRAAPATTTDVRRVVEQVMGFRAPALMAQVFQALRIAVNDELRSLDVLLEAGSHLLRSGGRMGIISYHSLEDRRVKRVFRALTVPPRDPGSGRDTGPAPFALLTRSVIVPSPEEVHRNPRSRSAKFRAIISRASLPS
jgi:16S rRNA (cytosine1402-N4)-methyltransferase